MPFSEGDAMDKIIVNGLKLYAYHGVNPEEKEDGQLLICSKRRHKQLPTLY